MQQRLESLEDEMETVKDLLMTAARMSERNTEAITRLTTRQESSQFTLERLTERVDNLTSRVDELAAAQQELTAAQQRTENSLDRLANLVVSLTESAAADRSAAAQDREESRQFRASVGAAIDRIDRVLDYVVRELPRGE